MNKQRWTEAGVFNSLRKVFPDGAYVLLSQVRNGTGYSRGTTRTADAIAVSCWPSRGLYISGIEIKVSLADWRKELADAAKADSIGKYCKYWFVAAPKGVIPEGEIPDKWGFIECTDTGAKIVKAASANEETPIDILLLASILRSVSKSVVPKHEVDDLIKTTVEESVARNARIITRERDHAIERIQKFEEASGVHIDTWNGGRIGEAVKTVLATQHIDPRKHLQNLADSAQRIVDLVNEALVVQE
jgi:hypothetical protein